VLIGWHNLLFIIPLAAGALLALVSVVGLGDGGGDGHDAAGDAGDAGDADGDAGEGDAHHGGVWDDLFSLLGVGKVPLSVLLSSAAILFGASGLIANLWLARSLPDPWLFAWISLAVAAVTATAGTALLARIVGRLLRGNEGYKVTKAGLLGRVGTLVLGTDASSGLLQVRDDEGNLHQVRCRVESGSLPKGTEVLVVDMESDLFVVEKSPLSELTPPRRPKSR
jgi:membrane protein implicated in regulation of membrane protease activity